MSRKDLGGKGENLEGVSFGKVWWGNTENPGRCRKAQGVFLESEAMELTSRSNKLISSPRVR